MKLRGKEERDVWIDWYKDVRLGYCAGAHGTLAGLCRSCAGMVHEYAAASHRIPSLWSSDGRRLIRAYRARLKRRLAKLEAARQYEAAKEEMLTPTEGIEP